MIQVEASKGGHTGHPVTQIIYQLCCSGPRVTDVRVAVADVTDDDVTVVNVIATVSGDVPVARIVLLRDLGRLLLNKKTRFDLLVRQEWPMGDAIEMSWWFKKNLVVDGNAVARA